MKLLAKSLGGDQTRDRSRHTITNYLNDEKAHKALNSNFFKRLNYQNADLYEVEAVKPNVDHKEPTFAGSRILQFAELHMLDSIYNSFDKCCAFNPFEKMEMYTDSFFLSLSWYSLKTLLGPK